MIYDTVTDILREYPLKVKQWVPLVDSFSADISDFGLHAIRDPWNRPFPRFEEIKNNEGEILCWHFFTTINSQEVKCVLFND